MEIRQSSATAALAPEDGRSLIPANQELPLSQRHLPALDGIRGLAVLWVIAHNTTDQLGAPDSGPFHLLALLLNPGWIGVQIFFALSGFLITGGLLDTQKATNYLGSFYARRALRIMPLYFLVLFSLLVLMPALVEIPARLQSTVQHQSWLWLFVSNWAPTGITGDFYGFGHFWSLAIEEQFYLLWPLVVFRQTPRRLFISAWRSPLPRSPPAARLLSRVWIRRPSTTTPFFAWIHWRWAPRAPRWCASRNGPAGCAATCCRSAVGGCMLFVAGIAMTRGYNMQTCRHHPRLLRSSRSLRHCWSQARRCERSRATRASLVSWQALRSCGKYSYAMYVFHVPIHKLVGTAILASLYGAPLSPTLVIYALGWES